MKIFIFYFFLLFGFNVNYLQATKYIASGCPGPVFWGAFDATCPFFSSPGGTRLTVQPAAGDILEIPAGCTVTVNQNFTINNNITINVYGQLKFQGSSNALNFDGCSSQIIVYSGGSISASSSSNQIKICSGGAEWKGPGTSTGPFMITNGTLPIELIEFTGTCLSNGVELNWSTASEENNDYFLVEKSSNGTDWELVAKITGSGTSGVVNKYVHIDYTNNNELTYYRLTQVDKNTTKEVFKAVDVNCKNVTNQMILYPNPSSTELNILLDVTTSSNNNYIKILNSVGQIVIETKVDVTKGVNTFVLPVDIMPGTYNIMFSSDNIVLPSQKLMIIK